MTPRSVWNWINTHLRLDADGLTRLDMDGLHRGGHSDGLHTNRLHSDRLHADGLHTDGLHTDGLHNGLLHPCLILAVVVERAKGEKSPFLTPFYEQLVFIQLGTSRPTLRVQDERPSISPEMHDM